MGAIFTRANKNKWLGQPATAQGVVPASAGPALIKLSAINYVCLHNRNAAPIAMALVGLLPDSMWQFGAWVNATTTLTDDTADAQSAATNDVALETATGANDGFVIGADVPFGCVSIDVTTAQAAASAVHIIEYWNGSAWTAIPAAGCLHFDDTNNFPRSAVWATGEHVLLFTPPMDWAVGGSGTGVSQTRYNLRVRGTPNTGTQAGLARRIYVGEIYAAQDLVAVNGIMERFIGLGGWTLPSYIVGLTLAVGGVASPADDGNALELYITP